MDDAMNHHDHIQREVEGFARRGLGNVTDVDDILDAEERRRQGERRRATDEADGYVEEDNNE